MNPEIEKLRVAIRDLETQHATGFVDDKQYAEDRAYLEQRLVQAVLKDESVPTLVNSPAEVANAANAAGDERPPADSSRVLKSIAAGAVLLGCSLALWWWISLGPDTTPALVNRVTPSHAASAAAAASAPTSEPMTAKAVIGEVTSAFIEGTVSLSPQLTGRASPSDTVLVYLRAPSGPAMPLALTKFQVKDLPQRFRFDDSMALWSTAKLSSFSSVEVLARISKNGAGALSAGDLHGQSGLVPLGSQAVRVEIDTLAR